MIERNKILSQLQSLPTLSTAAAKISALAGDDRASARDWESAIAPDPALTANLLRLVNSTFFGHRGKIETVRHAIALLGTKKVFDAVMGACFVEIIPESIPGYCLSARAFWMHSSAVAVLSDGLARKLMVGKPDLAFTAGLLHDLGKLALGVLLEANSDHVLHHVRDDGLSLASAEGEVLGMDHAEAGGVIMEAWHLPSALCQAATWHHTPDSARSNQHLVDLVHVADCLAHALGLGCDVGELSREITQSSIHRLGGSVHALEQVAAETLEHVEMMGSLMDTPRSKN